MGRISLWAHPEYYDYMHTITFLDDEKVELFYGECQGVRYEAVGDYSLSDTTLTIIHLKEVNRDTDTDDNDQIPAQVTDISSSNKLTSENSADTGLTDSGQLNTTVYRFRKETGLFEWVEDLTGHKKTASERYVFDQDPCGVDIGEVTFYKKVNGQ